jgi:copper chaperone CopZ
VITFEVEEAGCSSCAARVRDALSPLAAVYAVEIDETADRATVRMDDAQEGEIATALAGASEGSGHSYRVSPGSIQPA